MGLRNGRLSPWCLVTVVLCTLLLSMVCVSLVSVCVLIATILVSCAGLSHRGGGLCAATGAGVSLALCWPEIQTGNRCVARREI